MRNFSRPKKWSRGFARYGKFVVIACGELSFYGRSQHQGSLALGHSFVLRKTEILDLSYIVNHAVQGPLDINLDFPPEGKPVQPLPSLQIRKHGLGDRYPLVVDIPSSLGIHLLSHLFNQIARSGPYRDT